MTLVDVAQYAGVSASTASRALNGRGELSSETRAAVLEAADALQFQPSHLARSLRTQTTSTVGFVVPDVSSPFYASALKGAQVALEQAGYRVMLMDCGQSAEGEVAALRTLLAHRVDGLLLSTVGIEPDLFDDVVGRRGVPCVFFDSALAGAGDGSVLLDNVSGIDLLVGHLVEHGHRRLGFLAARSARRAATSGSLPSDARSSGTASTPRRPWWRESGGHATTAAPPRTGSWRRPPAPQRSSPPVSSSPLARSSPAGSSGSRSPPTLPSRPSTTPTSPSSSTRRSPRSPTTRRRSADAAAELLVEAIRDGDAPRLDVTIPVDLIARRSCGCGS